MNKEHVLFCIIGRTASGKDRLITKICELSNATQLISYTTRERRVDEGDTHRFVSEEDYQQMYTSGQIAAYTQIGAARYWCTFEQLYESDYYAIDYLGLQRLRELNLPNLRLVSVFINTPDDVREYRALHIRKDSQDKFRKRNLDEREQFRTMLKNADFDYAISNIDFAKACSCLKHISNLEGVWKNKGGDKE